MPDTYVDPTGELMPGWLHIQWLKMNNLTSTLAPWNTYYTPEEKLWSGGGFGWRYERSGCAFSSVWGLSTTFGF